MATYEIDMTDEAVRSFVHDLRELLGGVSASHIADILEAQIPVPVPGKVGAVVRTENHGTLTRVRPENQRLCEWVSTSCAEDEAMSTDEIGRVTEVLSEGVDL